LRGVPSTRSVRIHELVEVFLDPSRDVSDFMLETCNIARRICQDEGWMGFYAPRKYVTHDLAPIIGGGLETRLAVTQHTNCQGSHFVNWHVSVEQGTVLVERFLPCRFKDKPPRFREMKRDRVVRPDRDAFDKCPKVIAINGHGSLDEFAVSLALVTGTTVHIRMNPLVAWELSRAIAVVGEAEVWLDEENRLIPGKNLN
jgi:hypothetical protein